MAKRFYCRQDLYAIRSALRSGRRNVKFSDRATTFLSQVEMLRAERDICRALADGARGEAVRIRRENVGRKAIDQYQDDRHVSASEAARFLGFSTQSVYNWQRGKRPSWLNDVPVPSPLTVGDVKRIDERLFNNAVERSFR
jgi:hypothetical protein